MSVDNTQLYSSCNDLAALCPSPVAARNGLILPEQSGKVRRNRTNREKVVPNMGTIIQRKLKSGEISYSAQIVVKKGGETVHREAKAFKNRPAARAWLKKREDELSHPGRLGKRGDPLLSAVIDRYIDESNKAIGRTKEQVLRTIKTLPIAMTPCSEITSADIVTFAKGLDTQPQTRSNYLSHLAAVFAIARPMWGYALDQQAMKDAFAVCNRMGITGKSVKRDRRPTIAELDKLMEHFGSVKAARPDAIPMRRIIAFALFSTRRQEEITRILWSDYEPAGKDRGARVLVRDMKNPGDKIGNNVWCDLPPEAAAIIEAMPKVAKQIFPFKSETISAAFTRACSVLKIDDLHFHDLRHEGVSRLFEMGTPIPNAAKVSGHRSWSSLQRYSHIRQAGDKYEGWKWKLP